MIIHGCVSVNRCRSANYNNSNNFCLVNTNGNANNNNANNSRGLAPGFCESERIGQAK